MKKINPQIKNKFTLKMQDKIDAVEAIASVFFQEVENEYGVIEEVYTPYLEEIGQVTAIAKYFISGIEFDEDEDIYESVIEDMDIRPMIDKFLIPYGEKLETPTEEQKLFGQVMDKVYDVVEYRKAVNIAKAQNEANDLLNYRLLLIAEKEHEKLEKEIEATEKMGLWLDEQRKLNAGISQEDYEKFVKDFDATNLTEVLMSKYSESELGKKNREIVDANRSIREKDNKIIELQTAIEELKQKENVKNVLADKPKRGRKKKVETTAEAK